ncbi:uridine kinase [bacterium]|nr:uridine kinase [bacterium]
MKKGFFIGICGGTGSGKSLLARKLYESLASEDVAYIQQDSYYKDWPDLPFYEREKRNFDHPDAYHQEQLREHITILLKGGIIEQPVYDFTQHCCSNQVRFIGPVRAIIMEGILIFADEELRDMMNLKVFVDTPADTRLCRRILRDIHERGRTAESVIRQYELSVKLMHEMYIEPCKKFADIVLLEGGMNDCAVDLLKAKIESALQDEN